jgi:hypothetical protein
MYMRYFYNFSNRAEEIMILIDYLINQTSCIYAKKSSVTALETPIQTQPCINHIHCTNTLVSLCFLCFEHMTHLLLVDSNLEICGIRGLGKGGRDVNTPIYCVQHQFRT